MNHLIEQMIADGLTLSISEDGNLDVIGDQEVINHWIGIIKENKAAILAELKQPATDGVAVTSPLQPRYIVTVKDATTDPVLLQVTINGLASFDLAIPLAKYDPFAIMDAMDHYSPMAALARDVAIPVPAHENERTVGLSDEHEREAA